MSYSGQLLQIWYSERRITYAFNEQTFRSHVSQSLKFTGAIANHESRFDSEPRQEAFELVMCTTVDI